MTGVLSGRLKIFTHTRQFQNKFTTISRFVSDQATGGVKVKQTVVFWPCCNVWPASYYFLATFNFRIRLRLL